MLLAMAYHKANEEVRSSGAVVAAPAAEEAFHASNPMVVHVGRMMVRLVPFLIVMLN